MVPSALCAGQVSAWVMGTALDTVHPRGCYLTFPAVPILGSSVYKKASKFLKNNHEYAPAPRGERRSSIAAPSPTATLLPAPLPDKDSFDLGRYVQPASGTASMGKVSKVEPQWIDKLSDSGRAALRAWRKIAEG